MEPEDYLPIYSLAEWHYCPRSAFLSWFGAERRDTVTPAYQRMREEHAVSNVPSRRDKTHRKSETAVRLLNRELRIAGKADAVEWRGGLPLPVEYKNCAEDPPLHIIAQLTLQTLCLEEMYHTRINRGVIFRVLERRRIEVCIDEGRRIQAQDGIEQFRRSLLRGMNGFAPKRQRGCAHCIYRTHCWPEEFPHL
jgi:CRISPR-associated exonuclease Cas4